jgi:prepilin-type N-terminal cleavage/methylation domain-containing protein
MRVPHAPRPSNEDGFSLIEVLIALVLMVMVAGLVASGLITVAKMDRSNRERTAASALVEQQLNTVRVGIASLGFGTTESTATANGTTFTLVTSIEPVSLGASTGPCDGGAASGTTMTVDRITVTATWPKMGAIKPVRADTEVAPKTPLGTSTYNVGIKVVNAANLAVYDHTVTLTPGGASTKTDADGCAFFTGLAAGTYTGALNDSFWVDNSLKQAATSAAVGLPPSSGGQTNTASVYYDSAATLSLVMPGTAAFPMPATMPVTVTATGLKSGGSAAVGTCYGTKICGTFTGSSSVARTISGLYPFTTGYTGWIGDCAGANLAPDNYAVTAGGTTTATGATGGAVKLTATKSGGTPNQNVTISQVAGSSGCPAAESYSIGTTSGSNANTVQAWMPYGTWTVTMTNASTGVKTISTVTVAQTSTVASPAALTMTVS